MGQSELTTLPYHCYYSMAVWNTGETGDIDVFAVQFAASLLSLLTGTLKCLICGQFFCTNLLTESSSQQIMTDNLGQ